MTIQPNSHVTLAYTLRNEAGDVLDASDAEDGEPIRYVHGYGMIVPGLEAALTGLKSGDRKDVHIGAEEGFGARDEDLVVEIDRSELPNPGQVQVGDELVAESADGDEVVLRVVAVQPASVLVDANHPLAGVALHYSVHIQEVRPATDDEISRAAADLDHALEEIGAFTDTDPQTGTPLIQLGPKSQKLLH